MRDVAVVGFVQSPSMRREPNRNEVEILVPVIAELKKSVGIANDQIDFVCSGSSDYLAGQSFAFVAGLDAVGAWPPVSESHVEMDGAWALYEAWVKMQMGYADVALVYGFGKPSMGDLPLTMALQLDPYTMMPLWPDAISLAALQARLLLENGHVTEREMAERAVRDRRNAKSNPFAQVKGDFEASKLLAEPTIAAPLRTSGQFPPLVTHMVAVGERSGELEAMLAKVADTYDEQVETAVTRFTAVLQPVLILFMVGIVAIIILAVLLPLMSITSQMQR